MSSPATLTCPLCHGSDVSKVKGHRAVCRPCSAVKRQVVQFCWACQRAWPDHGQGQICRLPRCALRAALLSEERIGDLRSAVRGCPFFRACPRCKALLTHTGVGCPNIRCPDCHLQFCFRCLRTDCYGQDYDDDDDSDDDDDDDDDDGDGDGDGDDLYNIISVSVQACKVVDNTCTVQGL